MNGGKHTTLLQNKILGDFPHCQNLAFKKLNVYKGCSQVAQWLNTQLTSQRSRVWIQPLAIVETKSWNKSDVYQTISTLFRAIGFFSNGVTDKSPVEYWFIKTETRVFKPEDDGLIKPNENMELD